jgi:two-component system, chemotaxis family, CheB/CheR fusion protein
MCRAMLPVPPILLSANGAARRRSKRLDSAPSGAEDRQPALEGVRVLLVEDDPGTEALLSLLLWAEGASVTIARSAEEALATLRHGRPHLILVDLVLPRMSGVLLVQKVKTEPWARDVAVLALTSFGGPEAARIAREAGCARCIRKPVDPALFARTVAGCVELAT